MSSTCEQQLLELQELYDSQQLLTEELSDKLDRTEVYPCVGLSYHCSIEQYPSLFCSCSWKKDTYSYCCMELQKKLVETEHAFFDLEEKHRQANATIKEKEFLIINLLKSGEKSFICPSAVCVILDFLSFYFSDFLLSILRFSL